MCRIWCPAVLLMVGMVGCGDSVQNPMTPVVVSQPASNPQISSSPQADQSAHAKLLEEAQTIVDATRRLLVSLPNNVKDAEKEKSSNFSSWGEQQKTLWSFWRKLKPRRRGVRLEIFSLAFSKKLTLRMNCLRVRSANWILVLIPPERIATTARIDRWAIRVSLWVVWFSRNGPFLFGLV